MKISKVYISGPMTGLPEFNYPAFNAAAGLLRGRGFEVVNPAELATGNTWEWYMRQNIKDVCDVDGLVLLEGWQNSKGAQLEVYIAKTLGMPITELSAFE